MRLYVVRAFVQLRELLTSNTELARRIDEPERKLEGHDEPRREREPVNQSRPNASSSVGAVNNRAPIASSFSIDAAESRAAASGGRAPNRKAS